MIRMSFDTPIRNKESLVQQVIDKITDAVINRELCPGDQLPTEIQLTEMLQVGKSSIREAIKVLQAMGVVEVRRGEGTFISTGQSAMAFNPVLYSMMTEPEDSKQLLELRMIFEPAYTVLAMNNASAEDMKKINEARLRFDHLAAQRLQTGKDDIEFHRAILNATHNNYVIQIGEMILRILLETVSRGSKFNPEQSMKDHKRIYEAMLTKDPEKVTSAVLKSFEGWMNIQV